MELSCCVLLWRFTLTDDSRGFATGAFRFLGGWADDLSYAIVECREYLGKASSVISWPPRDKRPLKAW